MTEQVLAMAAIVLWPVIFFSFFLLGRSKKVEQQQAITALLADNFELCKNGWHLFVSKASKSRKVLVLHMDHNNDHIAADERLFEDDASAVEYFLRGIAGRAHDVAPPDDPE